MSGGSAVLYERIAKMPPTLRITLEGPPGSVKTWLKLQLIKLLNPTVVEEGLDGKHLWEQGNKGGLTKDSFRTVTRLTHCCGPFPVNNSIEIIEIQRSFEDI
jgi:Ni2+-binding GTPase involved in maturation of urease and hydrogenase